MFINSNILLLENFPMDETTASKYALQVALQTMKDRCQQVQNRLTFVEDENLKLKLEVQKYASRKEEVHSYTHLEEQITELSKQKALLAHHICLVANENKQLWTKLSELSEVNESLGGHLNKISDTLNKHPVVTPKPNNSLNLVAKLDNKILGTKDESLEEISLKILNSFKQEKFDLERQYNEMVELQKIGSDFMSFSDYDNQLGEIRSELILDELKNCKEQLNTMEKTVKLQKEFLLAALEKKKKRKSFLKNKMASCDTKDGLLKTEEITISEECDSLNKETFNKVLTHQEPPEPKQFRTCPLCQKTFEIVPVTGGNRSFVEFQEHVDGHFIADEESELASILANFDIVGTH